MSSLQDESLAKLAVKQSRLRVVDLGSNRLRTFPRALVRNSPRLNALHLDDNRLADCSQVRVLRRAANLELFDLSANHLTALERRCFDGLAAGAALRLAGNPFRCSCETADVARWLADRPAGPPEVVDRDSVTCSGPSQLAGTHLLVGGRSSGLPGSWQCRWRADVLVMSVVLLSAAVAAMFLILVGRRVPLCRRNTASVSGCQNGTACISSVTISNSCYRNGAAGGPGRVGGEGEGSAAWGGESNACLLYTSPSPRDRTRSRMPSSA